MSLASLIATGTKVWLDGIEPDEIARNHAWGITGATSNPTIISKIIGRGHFDERISILIERGLDPFPILVPVCERIGYGLVRVLSRREGRSPDRRLNTRRGREHPGLSLD